MVTFNTAANSKIVILLASGFEESPVVYCLDQMREAGLPVSLVSLYPGTVTGLHGLVIRPDHTLEQLSDQITYRGVLMSGGQQCISSLLADPRTHRLIEKVLRDNGFVAATPTASMWLARAGNQELASMPQKVEQGAMNIDEFAKRLIDLTV